VAVIVFKASAYV